MNVELFEKAVRQGEIHDFFMGNGNYFLRNRETHGHSFYMSVENVLIDYLDQGDFRKIDYFIDSFKGFIDLPNDSSKKFNAILKNIYAICDIISTRAQYSCDNEIVEYVETSIYNYFQRTKFSNDDLFEVYFERIESTGCIKISSAIRGDKYASKE